MVSLSSRFLCWMICLAAHMLLILVLSGHSESPGPPTRNPEAKFKQKTSRFWEFEEQTNSWVEISLPYDLMSCINSSCTKVGLIESMVKKQKLISVSQEKEYIRIDNDERQHNFDQVLPLRKRISLTRMSEASVWVTGQSGSIYERFWNGVQWVIAPHELPTAAGGAVSTFIVNQTIFALSEDGKLYQLQLNEKSQPIWTEFILVSDQQSTRTEEIDPNQQVQIKTGVVSSDLERLFLSTMNGTFIEISQLQPLRWANYGRPPGGDVSAIADTGNIRPGVLFTISSSGDLYEFDKNSKPSWKKHIQNEASMEEISLRPSTGCTLHGLVGVQSVSLFLITKDGFLVERRLHRRKWKWIAHGAPKDHRLSSITPVHHNELNEKILTMFFTTTTGCIFEYHLPKHSGGYHGNEMQGLWINHLHPQYAKVARGIRGVHVQTGRIMFSLDDGRLAELHLPGIGGDDSGPTEMNSIRKKASNKYEWSVLDVPETEGWNAEYCTEERGPMNCIIGTKDVLAISEQHDLCSNIPCRKRKADEQQNYVSLSYHGSGRTEPYNFLTKSIDINFRMRVMLADRSLFHITEDGLAFEYLYTDKIWLWLRHEHPTAIKGALGSYNGSLFLVDTHGSLLIRERNGTELSWINCTAMKNGEEVASGPPWDGIPGKSHRATSEDALFLVNRKGRLLEFMVSLRKFKWKNCQRPPDTKIAFIVDQEVFRSNIIFVVGHNGCLYQYNKVTKLWHKHYQSPHLVLSRSPGTAMRPSPLSLTGSIFMISENGGLIEYHWNSQEGWDWVEHGTPYRDVTFVGSPGPSFNGNQLFLVGSDGNVYKRHLDKRTWKWTNQRYPYVENSALKAQKARDDHSCPQEDMDLYYTSIFSGNCNEKVSHLRPIPFSENSIIFGLQDGRLAELRRTEGGAEWEWTRIISTPTSPCQVTYLTVVAK
ncbi:uncharacterized protein [Typha latifolia]|uniref:uncharacterized protein isoform X1 n=1 Tax=Typha latifolia TaxID=4733 RepID=UPI003C2E4033